MPLTKLSRLLAGLLVFACSTLIISCAQNKNELKFNKAQWERFDDSEGGEYPYRDRMLGDLVEHHQLKGLTYKQLIDSLGTPGNFDNDDDTVRYEIITGFTSDIDPTYGKHLSLTLGADSTVTSYRISEWKHN
ncbi:hypothetical protein [Hymenobacter daeguensis]